MWVLYCRRTCRRVVVLIGTDGFRPIVCWETGFLPADSVESTVFADLQMMFSNSKDSLWHQLGHEEDLSRCGLTWKAVLVLLTSQSHFILLLHKPGHDQYFLVCRTGSDWTAKLKQAEVTVRRSAQRWNVAVMVFVMCDMCCWQTHSDYTTCSDTHPLPHSSKRRAV